MIKFFYRLLLAFTCTFLFSQGLQVYSDDLRFEGNGKTYQKLYDVTQHDYAYWSDKCTGTADHVIEA